MNIKDDDLCFCGNGRLYQDCHKLLAEAPNEEKCAMAQKIYARDWVETSKNHKSDGIYNWGAVNLEKYQPRRILDIGCGSGDGLVALIETFGNNIKIVSLDENPHCIDAAQKTLEEKGITVSVIKRGHVTVDHNGFQKHFSAFEIPESSQVTLIESDICHDPYLENSLRKLEPFDLITVWFIGTHTMIQLNKDIQSSYVKSNADYRIYVQNKAYDLGELFLRPKGILNAIDRLPAPFTDKMRAILIEHHTEQASTTSLAVTDVFSTPYSASRSHIGLVQHTDPTDRSSPTQKAQDDMLACSIISQKPQ